MTSCQVATNVIPSNCFQGYTKNAEINADIWCKTPHFSSLTTSIVHFLEYYTAILTVKEACNNVYNFFNNLLTVHWISPLSICARDGHL